MRGNDIMRAAGEAGRRKGLPNTLQEHEILMGMNLKELGYGDYEREFKFCPSRKWLFDFAVPRINLAVELEGGIWIQGRHSRGAGYQSDLDKYNTAILLNWTVFRFSVADVLNGQARETLRQYKKVREGQ